MVDPVQSAGNAPGGTLGRNGVVDHELISTACVPATEGYYLSTETRKGRERTDSAEMDQVLAWRIDTFKVKGDTVPMSTITPITINGSMDTVEFAMLRPDGVVEYPDGASIAVGAGARLRVVEDKL
ncbi:hypothetical protein EDF57_10252 [Novosphingobium sp. PhB55]|nr:hypothetical protein EDF57_10252 [Novosphingobium sp. PhB55]